MTIMEELSSVHYLALVQLLWVLQKEIKLVMCSKLLSESCGRLLTSAVSLGAAGFKTKAPPPCALLPIVLKEFSPGHSELNH